MPSPGKTRLNMKKWIMNCNSNKWLSPDMNLFRFDASDLHVNQISSDYSGVLIFNYNMQNNPWTWKFG